MGPLVILAIMWFLLRPGQAQTVGKATEDVWVEGKLGGKVEIGCEEVEEVEEGGGCPRHCVWNGPQGVFCLAEMGEEEVVCAGGLEVSYTNRQRMEPGNGLCFCTLSITPSGEFLFVPSMEKSF